MRGVVLLAGTAVGSVAFQASVAIWPQYLARYAWAVKYVWMAWFVFLLSWLITHEKVLGRKLKRLWRVEDVPELVKSTAPTPSIPAVIQNANPRMEQHLHLEGLLDKAKPHVTTPPILPPKPKNPPNLQFRRRHIMRMWVGHELSGHSAEVLVAEIGNELGEQVGPAEAIRGHITYKNNNEETLQTLCPARWTDQTHAAHLEVGEGGNVVLALNRGVWLSQEYDGIDLRQCTEIQLRLLDENGIIVSGPIIFDCRFTGGYEVPVCQKR